MPGEPSNQNSFFSMIYVDLIPADHLLCKLAMAMGLGFVSELISDCSVRTKDCAEASVLSRLRAEAAPAKSAAMSRLRRRKEVSWSAPGPLLGLGEGGYANSAESSAEGQLRPPQAEDFVASEGGSGADYLSGGQRQANGAAAGGRLRPAEGALCRADRLGR